MIYPLKSLQDQKQSLDVINSPYFDGQFKFCNVLDNRMTDADPPKKASALRKRALSRWDNEGGAIASPPANGNVGAPAPSPGRRPD
ncbi:MAG: hypothetical protein K2W86_07630 [Sphingomonas sp.]|nr:hypothetical protein [Sphingomonas sp.]